MDKRILFLLFLFLLWVLLGSFICPRWSHGGSSLTKSHSSTLSLLDGSNTVAETEGHFNFRQSSNEYITPIDASVTSMVDKIAAHLAANTNKAVQITGFFTDTETNSTSMKNLGLARASQIKQLLTNKNVPEDQITVAGQQEDDMILLDDNTNLRGPITFTLIDKPHNALAFTELKERFQANPVVIQFKKSNDHPQLSLEQRKDIGDLIYYIKNVSGSSIDLTGHTDSRGGRTANVEKGKKWAQMIKDYMVENGLVAARANVISLGPDKPADNNAKNNRVEITLN